MNELELKYGCNPNQMCIRDRCKSYLEQIRIRLQKNRVDLCIICIIMSNTNKDV